MKNILILNGSPRPNGNTMELIRAFTAGAEEAGHSVTRFDLQKMNIKGCIGCMKGGKDPLSPCVQKDDMDKIYPVYRECDVFVFASPLYYFNFSGQLRIARDRLLAVGESYPDFKAPVKQCAMLVAAGDSEEWNFAPLISNYDTLNRYLGWEDIGKVLAGGVLNVGDIKGKPFLNEARQLGRFIH